MSPTRPGINRRAATAALLLGSTSTVSKLALAADAFPSRPIMTVVPFPPGGSSDATMRAISTNMGKTLGQPVVLENKPGANGTIGALYASRQPADGYTLVIGAVGTWAITPTLLKTVGYDARKDFDLLTIATRSPNVLVVPNALPVNSLAEFIAYLKKNPGKGSFASSGIGSSDHLTAALFWQKTGTKGTHVAYRGAGAAISDVIAGHVDALITNVGTLSAHVKSGKVKALAVTADARVPELPDVPTMAEAGVEGLSVYSWQAICAPKGLPTDVKAKLHAAIVGALKDPGASKFLQTSGFEVVASTPQEFASVLDSEIKRWKNVIDTAGIQPE